MNLAATLQTRRRRFRLRDPEFDCVECGRWLVQGRCPKCHAERREAA